MYLYGDVVESTRGDKLQKRWTNAVRVLGWRYLACGSELKSSSRKLHGSWLWGATLPHGCGKISCFILMLDNRCTLFVHMNFQTGHVAK